MIYIALSRLHLDRENLAIVLDNEIYLSPFLAVVEIGFKTVRNQFLSHCILIDGTEVDVFVTLDNPHLNAVGILRCQQTDIVQEEFEKVAGPRQQKRYLGLLHIVNGYRNASIFQP